MLDSYLFLWHKGESNRIDDGYRVFDNRCMEYKFCEIEFYMLWIF